MQVKLTRITLNLPNHEIDTVTNAVLELNGDHIDYVAKYYPQWTSMVLVVVNPTSQGTEHE